MDESGRIEIEQPTAVEAARKRIMGAAADDAEICRKNGPPAADAIYDCAQAYWMQTQGDERAAVAVLGEDPAWELYQETFAAEVA